MRGIRRESVERRSGLSSTPEDTAASLRKDIERIDPSVTPEQAPEVIKQAESLFERAQVAYARAGGAFKDAFLSAQTQRDGIWAEFAQRSRSLDASLQAQLAPLEAKAEALKAEANDKRLFQFGMPREAKPYLEQAKALREQHAETRSELVRDHHAQLAAVDETVEPFRAAHLALGKVLVEAEKTLEKLEQQKSTET